MILELRKLGFDHCAQHDDDYKMMMYLFQSRYKYMFYDKDQNVVADNDREHSSRLNLDCPVKTQMKDSDRVILNNHDAPKC